VLWMFNQLSIVEVLSCFVISDKLDAFALQLLLTVAT
jgi:hypothetical protein